MSNMDKRDVIERIIYNIMEGTQTISQAKQDAERDMETQTSLMQGDLAYIRSRVSEYVKENEQWYDDEGRLQTTEIGQTLLSLVC
jgi:hypothetical protein